MGNGQSNTNVAPSQLQKAKSKHILHDSKTARMNIPAEPNFKARTGIPPSKLVIHEGPRPVVNKTIKIESQSTQPKQQQRLKPFTITYNRNRYQNSVPTHSKPPLSNAEKQFENAQIEQTPTNNSFRHDIIKQGPEANSNGPPLRDLDNVHTPNYEAGPFRSQDKSSVQNQEINSIQEKKNAQSTDTHFAEPKQQNVSSFESPQKEIEEPKEYFSSYDHTLRRPNLIDPEIQLLSFPNVRRQDLGTAQSTASSTARKLKIRGLKTFIEKHHGGTPPLWVKEFPCRSKFHPDSYIYDFEEGPFAPKRPAAVMNQCPRKGGRCTNCGVYTSDICMKCRMCELDCKCTGMKKLISPTPFPLQIPGTGPNNLDFVGNVLNQAQNAFEGLSKPEVPHVESKSQRKWPEKEHGLSSEVPRQYPFNSSIQRDPDRYRNESRSFYSSDKANSFYSPPPSSFQYPYPYQSGYLVPPYCPYPPSPWGMYPPTPYPTMGYPYQATNPYYSQPQHAENGGTTGSAYNSSTKVSYNNSGPI